MEVGGEGGRARLRKDSQSVMKWRANDALNDNEEESMNRTTTTTPRKKCGAL